MNEPTRQTPVLRLEWWRFAVVAFLALSIISGITLLGFQPGNRRTSVAMAVFGVSLVGFFAYRWRRLRADAAIGRPTPEEFNRSPRAYILGPVLPLVVWFAVTVAALIIFAVLSARRGT
jgi:uncharacterized membrane protein